jgi:hypothetical protein
MNHRPNMNRVACAMMGLAFGVLATRADEQGPLGGRVAWGRLVTGSSSWTVHSANDPLLARFIREHTSLNIDPTCYAADPARLEQLCAYPFIFTNNLTNVSDPQQLANLREYLRRGGFLYIDRCVNLAFSLPQEPFYERHIALFDRLFPDCEIRELPDNHEIYRCYFTLSATADHLHMGSYESGHNGIYGVYVEARMVALLSLANFQCGWPKNPVKTEDCMKMIANIYVYAMTRSSDAWAQR